MNMIGIELWTETYVVLRNKKVICTENTVEYLEEQMKHQDVEDVVLTVASWVKDITVSVKKADIDNYFTEREKCLSNV